MLGDPGWMGLCELDGIEVRYMRYARKDRVRYESQRDVII